MDLPSDTEALGEMLKQKWSDGYKQALVDVVVSIRKRLEFIDRVEKEEAAKSKIIKPGEE